MTNKNEHETKKRQEDQAEEKKKKTCTCGENCTCEENCDCDSDCDCEECDCDDCDCHDDDCDCEECDVEKESNNKVEPGHFHVHTHPHKEQEETPDSLYYLDMAQRIKADFDNFKKRNAEVALMSYTQGVADAVVKLLPLVDGVTLAKTKITDEKTLQGLTMLSDQLLKSFADLGVTPIDCVGKPFDPNFHQAVLTGSESNVADHQVLQELQTGFLFNNKVIRPSMVKVNKLS